MKKNNRGLKELNSCIKTIFVFVLSLTMCVDVFAQSKVTAEEVVDSVASIVFNEDWSEPEEKTYIFEEKTYILNVRYEKIDGKVYALITIQYPSGDSSCGPMCYQSTVRKRLNADVASFDIISEKKDIAIDKNKIFIQGMEKNEKENILAYDDDAESKEHASIIPSLTRTDYDLFDADPATLTIVRDGYNHSYFKDKDHVYYVYDHIPGADSKSFEYINMGYAKDKENVFHKNIPIENSDVETFEFLDGYYAKDKNNVCYNGEIIKNADSETFILLSFAFAKDTNRVYLNGDVLNMYDAQSFMVVAEEDRYDYDDISKQYYYLKDKHGVYINHEIIPYADPESFEMVHFDTWNKLNMYSKDKNHVYAGSKILQGADPATFRSDYDKDKKELVYFDKNGFYKNGEKIEIVPDKQVTKKERIRLGRMYSIDENGDVYCDGVKVRGADGASFSHIDSEGHAKDKNHVYYMGTPISDTPEDFDVSNRKDKQNAYYKWRKIEGADVESYVVLDTEYGKDKNYGYFLGKPIEGSDGATFVFHGMYLSGDANHVYFRDKIMERANPDGKYEIDKEGYITVGEHNVWYGHIPMNLNPKTFKDDGSLKEEGSWYIKSNKKVLFRSHPVIVLEDVDIKTFTALDVFYKEERKQYKDHRYNDAANYGKDKNHVYYEGIMLPNSDAKTFIFLSEKYTKDKNNVYFEGKIIEGADSKTFKKVDDQGLRWMDKNNTFVVGQKVDKIQEYDFY